MPPPVALFPGWDELEPVFQAMQGNDGNAPVHPAEKWGRYGQSVVIIDLDKRCRNEIKWFIDQCPDARPGMTIDARLVMLEGQPAILMLRMHAGDVDINDPPEGNPVLTIPMRVVGPAAYVTLRVWRSKPMIVLVPGAGRSSAGTAFKLPCKARAIKRAQKHTADVAAGGQGHRDAIPIAEWIASIRPVLPTDQGHTATVATLPDIYTADRDHGIKAAAGLMTTVPSGQVLAALVGIATPADLAAVAYTDGNDSPARTLLLAETVTDPVLLLDILLAHEASVQRRRPTADAIHPKHLQALFAGRTPDSLARAWEEAGRITPELRTAIGAMNDRGIYHRFIAAHRPTVGDRAATALADMSLAQLARDAAAQDVEPDVLTAACQPGGATTAMVLAAISIGRKQPTVAAASDMLDLGWDLVDIGQALAEGGRWKLLWKWLHGIVDGNELVATAQRCGMPSKTVLRVVDHNPKRALRRLHHDCEVPLETVTELAADLGIGFDPDATPTHRRRRRPPAAPTVPATTQQPTAPPPAALLLPVPCTVEEAVRIADATCDRLVFLNESYTSAATSQYPHPQRVLADLIALNALAQAWATDTLDTDFRTAAPTFGLTGYRGGISQTATSQYSTDYTREYKGRSVEIAPHIARGARRGANTIMRVYWYADEDDRVLVIGHVGAKLRDASHTT